MCSKFRVFVLLTKPVAYRHHFRGFSGSQMVLGSISAALSVRGGCQRLVIEPVSRQPRSQGLLAFQARKILGTRLVSLTRFRSKTDDLMENSRGKRCALDIQDYSQVDKLDVHLSYFLDIKSLTDFLKRENTKRIIYFFLLTQARFPFKKIMAWVFYLIPQKQGGWSNFLTFQHSEK